MAKRAIEGMICSLKILNVSLSNNAFVSKGCGSDALSRM
jgi:hypothetical protein